ncbi:MAG: hypothetical protein KBA51_01895 [Kiritimatiellae bacterium]|nr:hypothetical protein [Kiritimatiellia bacterium]
MNPSWPISSARPPMRDGEDFWADFRQRASGLERETRARPSHRREGLAAAAALLIGLAGWALWMQPTPADARNTEVISLDVTAPHDSLFMMPMEGGGVMVWIGMEEPKA